MASNKNGTTNPAQTAVEALANKPGGPVVKDPVTGKIHPIIPLAQGKVGRPKGPLSPEEKQKRMDTRMKNNKARMDVLTQAQQAIERGDKEAGAALLAQMVALQAKALAKDVSLKTLTKVKVNETLRNKYNSLGGDNWLLGLLNQ